MLEFLLMTAGREGVFYPDSGPGTKYLVKGTESYGYFGEVGGDQIGVAEALISSIPSGEGVILGGPSTKWLKFYHSNRVIFYPTSPLALLSYDALTRMHATFSSAQAGTPNVPTTIPQYDNQPIWSQNLIVQAKDQTYYRVRLFDIMKDTGQASGASIAPTGQEFIDMFTSVFKTGVPSPIFLKLDASVISGMATDNGSGSLYWGQEINPTGPQAIAFYGSTQSASFATATMVASSLRTPGWIPVLERLTDEEVQGILSPVTNLRSRSTSTEMGGSLSFDLQGSVFPAVNLRSPTTVASTPGVGLIPSSIPVNSLRTPDSPGPIVPSVEIIL